MKKRLLAMVSAAVLVFTNSLTASADESTTTFNPETTVQTTITTVTTKPRLTLDDVIKLSKKGNELTWSDFEKYEFEDIGSGLYINKYDLEDDYTLLVGGVPEESPYYILLYRNNDEKNGIDIRTEDVEAFLNIFSIETTTFKPETTVQSTTKTTTTTTTVTTKPRLTLDDIIELSKKGNELTWSDFEKYEFEDIGSGLYINKYDLEEDYTLLVGGVPEKSPYYILLYRNDDEKNGIDIRTEDVEAFLNIVLTGITTFKPETTAQSTTTTTTTTTVTTKPRLTLDDVIELSKKGNELTWSDFEKYEFEDIGSGLYINKYDLEDDYTLLVGGVPEKFPYYILLYRNDDEKNGIDIRTEDIEAFLYGDIQGDVNADGVFSVADVILLQKWLLSTSDTKLANWKAADFCEDGTLDVFDLCLMKKALIETKSNLAL